MNQFIFVDVHPVLTAPMQENSSGTVPTLCGR